MPQQSRWEEAWELYRQAREHKLLEGYHRRKARFATRMFEEFCHEHAIDLNEFIEEAQPHDAGTAQQKRPSRLINAR
jgi:hypothetical protein